MNDISAKNKVDGENLDQKKSLSEYLNTEGESEFYVFYGTDVFIVDGIKPVKKEEKQEITWDTITKYSFLDDKKVVK